MYICTSFKHEDSHLMDIANNKINFPLYLCEFAIHKKFFSPLRLYIYLKTRCFGQLRITPKLKRVIAKDLSISVRHIDNLLDLLIKRNWIGYYQFSGYYYIRGFDKIREIEGLCGRRGVWLSVEKDINNSKIFKAFVIGAVVGRLANVSKYKERHKQELEHFTGSSEHNSCNAHSTSTHFPVSCEAMSKIFGIAISTASLYKKLASSYKFIEVKGNLKRIILGKSKKEKDAEFVNSYRASYPEIAHKIVVRKGKVFLQEADVVAARMEYTKKWRPAKNKKFNEELI